MPVEDAIHPEGMVRPDAVSGEPRSVGGYRLLRLVGEGGMSTVHLSYNVLLHPDGTAKLADLGLTKRLSDDAHLTSLNQGVGTSYYMPYEQALNAALVDGRSDIFALGATLYHLLTAQVPFTGTTHEEVI